MKRKGESVNPVVKGIQRAIFETSGFPPKGTMEATYEIEGWGWCKLVRRARLRRFEKVIQETADPMDMLYQVFLDGDVLRVVVGGKVHTVQTFLHILERKA